MSTTGKFEIKVERPVYEETAEHMIALVNEVLEPFAAKVTKASFDPMEAIPIRESARTEILGADR